MPKWRNWDKHRRVSQVADGKAPEPFTSWYLFPWRDYHCETCGAHGFERYHYYQPGSNHTIVVCGDPTSGRLSRFVRNE